MDASNHPQKVSPTAGKKIPPFLLVIFTYLRQLYLNGTLPRIEKIASSRLGRAFSQGWPGRIWRFLQRLIEFPLRHLRDNILKGKISDLKLIYTFWKRGWLGRLELLMVTVGGVTVPTVLILGGGDGQSGMPLPILITSMVIYLLAYAFALAAAWTLPFWLHLMVQCYLLWFAFQVGASLAFTPLLALPALWVLVVVWIKARQTPGRWKYVWLLPFCAIISYHTYGAFGLSLPFHNDQWIPVTLLGVGYYLLSLAVLWKGWSLSLKMVPGIRFVFGGTLLVVGVFYALALQRDLSITASYAFQSMNAMLWVVLVIWMWLGATMVEGAIKAGSWWTTETVSLLTKRLVRWLIPIFWLVVMVVGWIATNVDNVNVIYFAHQVGLEAWVSTWSPDFYFSVQTQVYVSLAALIFWLISVVFRRYSDNYLSVLTSIWAAAFLAMVSYNKSLEGFYSSQKTIPSSWWLALVLVVGLIWEMVKAGENYLKTESPGHNYALFALIGLLLASSTITLGAGSTEILTEYAFYSFNGVINLGLPLLIYQIMQKFGFKALERKQLIALVVIGELSAIIPLCINPVGDWSLFLPVLVWLAVLLLWGKPLARMQGWLDGLLAGGAMAMGCVTYWMYPEPIPLPAYLAFLQTFQERYDQIYDTVGRPLLLEGQLWLSLGAVGLGLLAGWAAYWLQNKKLSTKSPAKTA